jgi:polar amino acid transport system substrate-binding protein
MAWGSTDQGGSMKLELRRMAVLLGALALVAAGCGGDEPPAAGDGTPAGGETVCASHDEDAGDVLAEICANGEIRVSTDPAYPPQSELNPETGEYEGFDIDVAMEIAERLGVKVAWETPKWEVLTAGSWNDRWDMSVGSMTPTNERQEVLNFTEPYSFVPAVVVVHEDSDVGDVSTDLDGAKIGVCADCTYQFFLEKSLAISGFEFDFVIDDARIQTYDTDTTALQDLALGDGTRLDAVMTSVTTAEAFAEERPVKVVGEPVFGEPLAIAFDKETELDNSSLVEAVDQIVADMHDDGTLTAFSEKWYEGIDVTKEA